MIHVVFISDFVTKAIRKELELKKEELRKAYKNTNKDEGQLDAYGRIRYTPFTV